MDAAAFRVIFPQFADTVKFPAETVTYWLSIGVQMVNPARWGGLFDHGVALFTAHNLTLFGPVVLGQMATGGIKGVATGKTVGKVSVTYDASIGLNEGAGHWNLSLFGLQFWQLARMAGAGGMQVGLPNTVVVVADPDYYPYT